MILITGATGTVGNEVVKRLSAQGVPVCAVTRDLRKAQAHPPPHARFVQGGFNPCHTKPIPLPWAPRVVSAAATGRIGRS